MLLFLNAFLFLHNFFNPHTSLTSIYTRLFSPNYFWWKIIFSFSPNYLLYLTQAVHSLVFQLMKLTITFLPSFRKKNQRRQRQPNQVVLPGKSHGQRSLVGCSPWGHEESDTYWATSLSLFKFMHWRRKWQPPPVFLPGESQGQGSLVGCLLWGRTESETTEAT